MTPTPPMSELQKLVPVVQADRDAVQDFHTIQIKRILAGDKTLGDDKGDAGVLVQAFARHRLAFQQPTENANDALVLDTDRPSDRDDNRGVHSGQRVGLVAFQQPGGEGIPAETVAKLITDAVETAKAITAPDAALRSALEEIKSQKAERNCSDDYNRGWEAARWSARNIAEKALAATPSHKRDR